MQTDLDLKLAAVSAAEATYTADVANVTNIQTAIATATSPLAPAQAQVQTDAQAFNAAIDAASAALLAAKIPLAPAS